MDTITEYSQQDLPITGGAGCLTEKKVDAVVEKMLAEPQVSCPVVHRFGPGLCIREVFMPAGTFAVGHYQKKTHANYLMRGSVTMLNDDGTTAFLEAPFFYVSTPGKKIGYVHEDMVWQNIYATNETEVDKVEDEFIDKSGVWDNHVSKKAEEEFVASCSSREDYAVLLQELGMTEEQVRAEVENEKDQIPMPYGSFKVAVGKSPIAGRGVFVTCPVRAGEVLAPARINFKRTPVGRFTNHSNTPNAIMVALPNGDIDLVATVDIDGSHGGQAGDEVTVDYRQARLASTVKAEV